MNKIDRLYKKALAAVRTGEIKERFIKNLEEIEAWYLQRQQVFKDGQEPVICDPVVYGALMQEYEELFGGKHFNIQLRK